MPDSLKPRRDRIRDVAAQALRRSTRPMHNSEITQAILSELALTSTVLSVKTVNTCLHDDPSGRFARMAAGTWDPRRP